MLTNTIWIKPKFKNSTQERTYIIPSFAVGRPDTISMEIYGDDSYGINIMVYNGILDPFKELTVNKILKYPPFDQLDRII